MNLTKTERDNLSYYLHNILQFRLEDAHLADSLINLYHEDYNFRVRIADRIKENEKNEKTN